MKQSTLFQETVDILKLETDIPCLPEDIQGFRNRVGRMRRDDAFFHNHDNSTEGLGKVLYRYPLIQYRSVQGQAHMVAFNEACPSLLHLADGDLQAQFPQATITCYPKHGLRKQYLRLLNSDQPLRVYKVLEYKPFSNQDYALYKRLPNFQARVSFLERTVERQFRAAIRALARVPTQEVLVQLADIDYFSKSTRVHGVAHLVCDIYIQTNVLVPDNLSIGNDVAYGFGVLIKK